MHPDTERVKLELPIINESGGFFDSVQIGDTIVKEPGSLNVLCINRQQKYHLKYACNDKNKENND
jgi:hypothetical protein